MVFFRKGKRVRKRAKTSPQRGKELTIVPATECFACSFLIFYLL